MEENSGKINGKSPVFLCTVDLMSILNCYSIRLFWFRKYHDCPLRCRSRESGCRNHDDK